MKEITRDEAFDLAEELGLDISKNTSSKHVAKKLSLVTGEEYEIVKSEETKEAAKTAKDDDDTLRCIIHSNDRDNDEIEVVGSVNGEFFQAQIGEEIDFPKKFIPALDGAYYDERVAVLDDDGNPTGKYKERRVKRYILERL